jgi:RNase P/RNase MRP subunit POP5|tara:strand:- start:894 stop:1184 length:291 start_codon:yes stop_codon:yes gene_type:complete
MKLKPSQRPKKRYIVFEMSKIQDKQSIEKSLWKLAKAMTQDDTKMKVIKVVNNKAMVRITNKHAKSFIEAMNATREFKTLGTSGILRVAEKKFLTA